MSDATKATLAREQAERLAAHALAHAHDKPWKPSHAPPENLTKMSGSTLDDAVKMLMHIYQSVPEMENFTEEEAYELLRNA